MNLNVLENRTSIKIADENFFNLIHDSSVKFGKSEVLYESFDGFRIQHFYEDATIHCFKKNIWFSYTHKYKRSFYAFGVDKPKMDDLNIPLCVIDFSMEGVGKNSLAAFAEDDNGNLFVLVRVNYPELRETSFSGVLIEKERIEVLEGDKKRYFINLGQITEPNFLENIMEFIEEIYRITPSDLDEQGGTYDKNLDVNHENESCVLCGKNLPKIKLTQDSQFNLFMDENPDKCQDCLEKIYVGKALKEVKNYVSIKVFNEKNLLKRVDNPDTFKFYLSILKKHDTIKNFTKDVYMFNDKKDLNEIINKYSAFLEGLNSNSNVQTEINSNSNVQTEINSNSNVSHEINPNLHVPEKLDNSDSGVKICEICGLELPLKNFYKSDSSTDNFTMKCKDCFRKSYAVKALEQILDYIGPETPFNKEDLLKQCEDRMKFLDYFWTLQEFDLIVADEKSNSYLLKPENELNEFIGKYGNKTPELTTSKITEDPKQKPKKIIKECEVCGQKLSISHFYNSSTSADGHSQKCKDCSRKSYAVKALIELKEYIEPGILFESEDLLEQCEDRMKFLDYFWTLQEFDLIVTDEKSNSYLLKPENELNSFMEKYGDKTPEEEIKPEKLEELKLELDTKEENPYKTEIVEDVLKECEMCGQKLPLSKFYKSSTTEDGYVGKCKECADKADAFKVLNEIQDYIELEKPFNKTELLKQIDNPTKVNYCIWTLQEQNLLEYNQKTDTYTLKINDEFRAYQELVKESLNAESDSEESLTAAESGESGLSEPVIGTENSELDLGESVTAAESGESGLGEPVIGTENSELDLGESVTAAESGESGLGEPVIGTENSELDLGESVAAAENSELDLGESVTAAESGESDLREPLDLTENIPTDIPDTSEEVHASEEVPVLDPVKKEIIYISEDNGSNINVMLKGIIENEKIMSTLSGLGTIISSNVKKLLINSYMENYSEIMLDLEINDGSIDEVLNLLEKENWKNFAYNK